MCNMSEYSQSYYRRYMWCKNLRSKHETPAAGKMSLSGVPEGSSLREDKMSI